MPKRLLDRRKPDCISEFRAAARWRFQDGVSLAGAGRRTATIYLWGYAAEMLLKAAYFHAIGFSATRPITPADLRGAVANAPRLGFSWAGNLHSLESWARLLVTTRASIPGLAYAVRGFANQVVIRCRQLQRLWSEILRYHQNVAYLYEVKQAREVANWLLVHSPDL
jgi:hypothetical protein